MLLYYTGIPDDKLNCENELWRSVYSNSPWTKLATENTHNKNFEPLLQVVENRSTLYILYFVHFPGPFCQASESTYLELIITEIP